MRFVQLGPLTLGLIPRVAISFKDKISPQTLRNIQELDFDIAELRIDQYACFDVAYVLAQVSQFKKFPSIATIRSSREGGHWDLSEAKRLKLFRAVIPCVNAVDIELSSKTILKEVIALAHKSHQLAIVSYHNFNKTPRIHQLNEIMKKAKSSGADIVKIATRAFDSADVRTLADFTIKNSAKNLITIAMGAQGTLSRIFFPVLGSLVTYASLGQATAPGQLDTKTTAKLLKIFYPK